MEVGCQVRTSHGIGNVVNVGECGELTVSLDDGKTEDGSTQLIQTTNSAILSKSFCDIGSCVYTKYGPGVLFKYHQDSEVHVIRLWRPRGQGSATAYMPRSDLIRVIMSMPGLSVVTPFGTGVVVMYHHDRDMYTVQLPFGVAHLNAQSILSCEEARVLPTAEYLADLTLASIDMNQLYRDFSENSTVKSVMEPISVMLEKFRGGQISSVDEVLSLRSKQLNDHVLQLDVKSLNKTLQDKIDSITNDSGKIEMLLVEGKARIAALIENAESRDELVSTTKTTLHDYLSTGKEQIDAVLGRLNSSSSTQEQDIIVELHTLSKDMNSSLSVIKNLAASDPVLEGLMKKLQDTNSRISEKAMLLNSALHESEAVQVLEAGGKSLKMRLANILDQCSGDVSDVKSIGENFLTALESKGAKDKGLALLDGVKARLLTTMQGGDDASSPFGTKALSKTIESNLVTMLMKWKTSSGDSEELLQTQLTRLTALLSLVSEGQLTLHETSASSREKVLSALGSAELKRQGNVLAREQLTRTLVRVKQGQEAIAGPISGYKFFKQFQLVSAGGAGEGGGGSSSIFTASIFQDSLKEVSKITSSKFKGILENVESPLLKDVARPIERVIDQIGNGEFNVEEAIQAAKDSLNSELLSSSAKEIVATGDQVMSVLEQFREHDAVRGVLEHLKGMDMDEQAEFLSNFNPDDLLAEVEQSFASLTGIGSEGGVDSASSQEARNKLINSTKDKVLGFLLEYVPSMTIPDIQGVKDDVQFAVTRLDMSGFKLKKEDVQVKLGTSIQEEFLVCEASNISAAFNRVKWKYQQLYFPYLSGTGTADATVLNASIRIGLKIIRVPKGTVRVMQSSSDRSGAYGSMTSAQGDDNRDARAHPDSSANTIFERFPHIKELVDLHRRGPTEIAKSSSTASLQDMGGGSESGAALWGDEALGWEPVLIMTSQDIKIQNLSLKIDDSSLAWLYNLLASVFEGIIREYVCKSLKEMLTTRSSILLGLVNSTAVNYWPVIHGILKVDILKLKDASAKDMAMLLGPPRLPLGDTTELEITPREYTLKFAESGPLGIKLDIFEPKKTSEGPASSSGVTKGCRVLVMGAVQGSQADRLFEQSGVRAFLEGATIVSVNGKSFKSLDEKAVLHSLKGARPMFITIKLSMTAWEQLGVHRSILAKEKSSHVGGVAAGRSGAAGLPGGEIDNKRKLRVIKVTFGPGPLGLKLKETRSCGGAVIVTGFSRTADDKPLQAELCGSLASGMVMLSVNGEVVFGRPFEEVMEVIKAAKRPMEMMFVPSPDQQFTFDTPPSDLVLGRIEGFVMVAAFSRPDGPSQQHKGICPGMVILQVNKEPVGSGMSPEEVEEMINRPFLANADASIAGSAGANKTKLAMRDMDSFMHLLRIRDGSQSIGKDYIEEIVPGV